MALAHGEDVLATLFAQGLAIVVCVAASFLLLRSRHRTWMGIAGCVAGVIASWAMTGNMPYNDNRTLIIVLDVALPLLGTFAAVVAARKLGNVEPRA
jgi:4-amino-4-deoxy-L-arabinose transferase-like glycosyltransferase